MSSVDIVIANALVAADFVGDLLRDMALPGFDILAAQGSHAEQPSCHSDLLPAWQAWPFRSQDVPNVAVGWSRHFSVPTDPALLRYLAQPVHFEVGTQGLVLEDPAVLDLSEEDASALQDDVAALFAKQNIKAAGGDATHWLLDVEPEMAMQAAVAELALHQDVLPWLPAGPGKRRWSQLSNELQMQLYQHQINDQRLAAGVANVSGLWLSGTGVSADAAPLPYYRITGMPAWANAWWLDPASSAELIGVTNLISPAGEEDWSSFRNALIGIDAVMMRHLSALRAGETGQVKVVFTGVGFVREVTIRRADLYKFWRRGKAVELFDLPE